MMQRCTYCLQVLERALRTGTVSLAASQADTLWSLNCGDAIEDVKQAVNRHALCPVFHLLKLGQTCYDSAALDSPKDKLLIICWLHVYQINMSHCCYVFCQHSCLHVESLSPCSASQHALVQGKYSAVEPCWDGRPHSLLNRVRVPHTSCLYLQMASLEVCDGSQQCHKGIVCKAAAAHSCLEEHQPVGLPASCTCSYSQHIGVLGSGYGQCWRS